VLEGRQDGLVDGNTYSYRSSRRNVFGVLHNFQRHVRVVPFPSKHLRTSEDRCHYTEIKLRTGCDSQSSNANQRPKFNVKRGYCPRFQVHVLTACRLEILETVCQESKLLLVPSSFINTSLQRSDHCHRRLLRYVWYIWLVVAGST
jgi:hypothetical protein